MKNALLILIFLLNINSVFSQDTWTEQKTNFPGWLKSISFPTNIVGYAVGSAGYILKTTDGGSTWAASYLKDNPNLYSVHFVSTTTGFVVSEGVNNRANVYKTTDGGLTWAIKAYADSSLFYKIKFASTGSGYLLGATPWGPILGKTTDQGETWTSDAISSTQPLGIDFDGNNLNGWYVGVKGIIYKSISGGTNWSLQISQTLENLESVQVVTPTLVFVVGEKGTVLKTTNGGSVWTQLPTIFTEDLYDLHFINDKVGWVVGGTATGKGKIFKTSDGGATWVNQYTNDSTNYFFAMSYYNDNTGWAAGDNGVIVKYTSSPTHSVTAAALSNSKYCKGSAITIPFVITGKFNTGNKFILQLSDEKGDFSKPIILGSLDQTTSGSILGFIPDTIKSSIGLSYKVRVVSTDPVVTGSASPNLIGIYSYPEVFKISGGGEYCEGDQKANFYFSGSDSTMQYQVFINGLDAGTFKTTGGSNIALPAKRSGVYKIVAINPNNPSCKSYMLDSAIFIIKPLPEKPLISYNNGILSSSSDKGNQWYFNGLKLNDSINQTMNTTVPGMYSLVVTLDGCGSDTAFYKVVINDINENELSELISPNPASDYISISLSALNDFIQSGDKNQVKIYNVLGVEFTPPVTKDGIIKIDISNFPEGIYLIKIGNRFEKFVKM
jgi:photosystem II stability/assembly factor-like uncharacterized protein